MCECNLFLDAFNRLLKSGKYYFTKNKWEFRVGCIFSSDFPCGREVGKGGTKNRNSDGKWRKTDVNKDSPAPPMCSFATSGCQLPGNVFKVLATLNPVCVEVSPKCGLSLMKSAYTLISLSNKTVCFVWMRIYCTSYEFIFILFISVRAACGWTWKHYDAQWQNEWMNGYRICLFTVYNISTVFSFAFCTVLNTNAYSIRPVAMRHKGKTVSHIKSWKSCSAFHIENSVFLGFIHEPHLVSRKYDIRLFCEFASILYNIKSLGCSDHRAPDFDPLQHLLPSNSNKTLTKCKLFSNETVLLLLLFWWIWICWLM